MVQSIVAIGGPHGSGKSSVAKRLASEFNMNYVSAGQVFRRMAIEREISLKEFSELVLNQSEIDIEIDNRTKQLGKLSNTIVDAQLAVHFTPKDAAIRISITASPEVRWSRIAKREKLSLEEAKIETITREKSERNRFLKLYDVDVNDFAYYDIVINNDRLNEEETFQLCKVIIKYVLNK